MAPPSVRYVYTDGSCTRNGHPESKAGIGIYFGEGDARNTSRGIGRGLTNNIAEATAIVVAIGLIKEDASYQDGAHWVIVTDSQYALGYATDIGKRHAEQNWSSCIPNKPLVRELYTLVSGEPRISLQKVAAHTNAQDVHSVGNANADALATRGASFVP